MCGWLLDCKGRNSLPQVSPRLSKKSKFLAKSYNELPQEPVMLTRQQKMRGSLAACCSMQCDKQDLFFFSVFPPLVLSFVMCVWLFLGIWQYYSPVICHVCLTFFLSAFWHCVFCQYYGTCTLVGLSLRFGGSGLIGLLTVTYCSVDEEPERKMTKQFFFYFHLFRHQIHKT
jgi:hypothetical protein